MATFDRFDICEAYLALDMDWNLGGMLPGRRKSVSHQLHQIQFRPSPMFNGWDSLSMNGREIYNEACERMRLGDGGYKNCACRDCFDVAIGYGRPMCSECQEAGCEPDAECSREDAYGGGNTVELDNGPAGSYVLTHEDGRTVLVQTDWDFPGLASNLGWKPCEECSATDGTIDCAHRTASSMIASAAEFLDEHIGDTFEDPGYFE